MRMAGLSRALLISSGSCAVAFTAAAVLLDFSAGRGLRLAQAIVFAAVMAAAVAVGGVIVQWPILRALHSPNRTLLAAIGGLLALIPFAALVSLFVLAWGDPAEDPQTVAGFIRFWWRVPGEFLVPFLPMMLAGAMLGWFAAEERGVISDQ